MTIGSMIALILLAVAAQPPVDYIWINDALMCDAYYDESCGTRRWLLERFTEHVAGSPPRCEVRIGYDFDLDNDVDLLDFKCFQLQESRQIEIGWWSPWHYWRFFAQARCFGMERP